MKGVGGVIVVFPRGCLLEGKSKHITMIIRVLRDYSGKYQLRVVQHQRCCIVASLINTRAMIVVGSSPWVFSPINVTFYLLFMGMCYCVTLFNGFLFWLYLCLDPQRVMVWIHRKLFWKKHWYWIPWYKSLNIYSHLLRRIRNIRRIH